MSYKEIANSAERILIPKGEDSERCVTAFEVYADIEVPTFKGEKLEAKSLGRTFFKVKGVDVPLLIARGLADVGTAGTDVCMEYAEQDAIRYTRIGDAMCRFMLLAQECRIEDIKARLENKDKTKPILTVPTSRPNLLNKLSAWQGLPATALELPLNGSIETMARLTGMGTVADLVETGETARQNGLVEVRRLSYIYPEIIAAAEIPRLETAASWRKT